RTVTARTPAHSSHSAAQRTRGTTAPPPAQRTRGTTVPPPARQGPTTSRRRPPAPPSPGRHGSAGHPTGRSVSAWSRDTPPTSERQFDVRVYYSCTRPG